MMYAAPLAERGKDAHIAARGFDDFSVTQHVSAAVKNASKAASLADGI